VRTTSNLKLKANLQILHATKLFSSNILHLNPDKACLFPEQYLALSKEKIVAATYRHTTLLNGIDDIVVIVSDCNVIG